MPAHDYILDSKYVGRRRVTVLLPDVETAGPWVTLFATDGQNIQPFAAEISRQLPHLKNRAFALIGVHSSKNRTAEYAIGVDDSIFERHAKFFSVELLDWSRSELGLIAPRENTGVFGYSNGGAFALTIASRNPEAFGFAIAFSAAGGFESSTDDIGVSPKYYLSAGKREKPLMKTTKRLAANLKRRKIEHEFTSPDSGHELSFWTSELPLALQWSLKL